MPGTPANALNISSAGIVTFDGTATFSADTVTQHNALVGGASNAITSVAPAATSGVALISQGAAADPAFGTVVVAGGGTGAVTLTGVLTGNGTSAVTANAITQHGVVIAGASNAVASVGPGATGTVLIGTTSSDPSFSATPVVTSITFGAGTALSTYVEGTWTPTIVGSSTAGTTNYSGGTQSGWYRHIGSVVYIGCTVKGTTGNTAAGNIIIGGLPITVGAGNSVNNQFGAFEQDGHLTFTTGYTYLSAQPQAGTTNISINQFGSAKAVAAAPIAASTDYNFQFVGMYTSN